LSFCPFSFGYCIVFPSSIYGFRLSSWYLQIFLEVVSQYIHLLFEETWVPGDPQIIDKPPPNITYTVCVESTSGQLFLESNSLLTWLVSYKVQKLLALREHLSSPPHFLRGPSFTSFTFSVLCCIVLFCFSFSCVLWVQCFQCLWIVHSWLTLWFSLTFIDTDCVGRCTKIQLPYDRGHNDPLFKRNNSLLTNTKERGVIGK
jgi:hypothetical protein